MQLRPILARLLVHAALAAPAFLTAQPAVPMPSPRELLPRSTVTFSLRSLDGASVVFGGGIGQVGAATNTGPVTGTAVARFYDDGQVLVDANGNPGGVTGSWSFDRDSQAVNGNIEFRSHRATATGNPSYEEDTGRGLGWEIGLARVIGRPGERFEWGAALGFGLNDVKAEVRDRINATLFRITDVYSLNGQAAPLAPYSAPSFTIDADGNTVDTTVALASQPLSRTETVVPGGTQIDGYWKLKGAYFTLRAGPFVRAMLGERIGISAGAGITAAFVGTRLTVEEIVDVADVRSKPSYKNNASESAWLVGVYGEANLEYWLTERAAVFAGVSYFQRGDYEQVLDGRTAAVDLGNTLALQLGATFRF